MSEKCFTIAYESAVAALERTVKRLWILAIILVILLVGSNIAWLYYESQFEETRTETTITQDLNSGDGGTITNGDVNINGEG